MALAALTECIISNRSRRDGSLVKAFFIVAEFIAYYSLVRVVDSFLLKIADLFYYVQKMT